MVKFRAGNLSLFFFYLIFMILPAAVAWGEVPPEEPTVVRVLLVPYLSFAPFFIAEERGYFAEEGIKVEYIRMDRSAEAVPALIQGELDALSGTIRANVLNAMARGARVRIVAGAGFISAEGCTVVSLMGRKDLVESGVLDRPGGLRGRRISFNPASAKEYYIEKTIKKAGLSLKDVTPVSIPNPAKLGALKDGSVDLADVSVPWITRLLRTGETAVWISASEVIPDFQISMLFFGPTLLDDDPETGERLVRAYLKGIRTYMEGKTRANVETIADATGLDSDLLEDCCWMYMNPEGRINVQSITDFQKWALEKGYLDRVLEPDQFWDPRFIEGAGRALDPGPKTP
jgi:NitT/TauT family transport system substrate-binding protein